MFHLHIFTHLISSDYNVTTTFLCCYSSSRVSIEKSDYNFKEKFSFRFQNSITNEKLIRHFLSSLCSSSIFVNIFSFSLLWKCEIHAFFLFLFRYNSTSLSSILKKIKMAKIIFLWFFLRISLLFSDSLFFFCLFIFPFL
jgi:hypothetical protein